MPGLAHFKKDPSPMDQHLFKLYMPLAKTYTITKKLVLINENVQNDLPYIMNAYHGLKR